MVVTFGLEIPKNVKIKALMFLCSSGRIGGSWKDFCGSTFARHVKILYGDMLALI